MPLSLTTRALLILASLNLLDYLDRYLVASLGSLIKADLHLSDKAFGFLGTAFFLVYFVTSPLFGYLGDRGGRLRLMAGGAVLWSLATSLTFWVPSYPFLVAARGLVGVGEASFGTLAPAYLADILPFGRRARALGLFYLALPVGSALAYLVGALVGSHWGWRPAFLLAGLPGLAMAGLIYPPERGPAGARGRREAPGPAGPPDHVLASLQGAHPAAGNPGLRHGDLCPGGAGVLDAPLPGSSQGTQPVPGQPALVRLRDPGRGIGDPDRRASWGLACSPTPWGPPCG